MTLTREEFGERADALHWYMVENFLDGATSLKALVGMACVYAKDMDVPEEELLKYVSDMFKAVNRHGIFKH